MSRSSCSTRTRSGSRRRHRRLGARDDPRSRAARPTSSSPRSATATHGPRRWARPRARRPPPAHGPDQRHTDPPRPAANLSFLRGGARATTSSGVLARRREHGQDDSRPRARRPLRHAMESGVRPRLLVVPRGGADDWRLDTSSSRSHSPRTGTRTSSPAGEPRPLLRHERLDDRALPRALPRPPLACGRPVRGREYDLTISATSRPRSGRTSSVRGRRPHRHAMHEAYLAPPRRDRRAVHRRGRDPAERDAGGDRRRRRAARRDETPG